MTNAEARQLPLGIYRLEWCDGGESLVAVGKLHDGSNWFAPINWTSERREYVASTDWSYVAQAWLILSQQDLDFARRPAWWDHKSDCRCETCKVHA